MKSIADHLFDIIENSVNAKARDVMIVIGYHANYFFCSITDNGSGISGPEVLDPFVTSRKTRRVGLGLPLLKKTAEDTDGYLKINRINPDGGTYLEFQINMSHIDAKPFGNLVAVFSDIVFAWPNIRLKLFIKEEESKRIILDVEKIKNAFDEELNDFIKIRSYIYRVLKEEFKKIGIF